jgi:hypothetical protein
LPIWPTYTFGGIAAIALYMCFATIWGWWPTAASLVNGDGVVPVAPNNGEPPIGESLLEIVRADFKTGTGKNPFPTLDITVRNTGRSACVIHEFGVDDLEQWSFPSGMRPSALKVSWSYAIDLFPESRSRTYRISQVVKPGEADRFDIRLGTSSATYPFMGYFLYQFSAYLVVNAERKRFDIGRFLVDLPQPMTVMAATSVGLSESELKAMAERARELRGKVDEGVTISKGAKVALEELVSLDAK